MCIGNKKLLNYLLIYRFVKQDGGLPDSYILFLNKTLRIETFLFVLHKNSDL